MMRSVGVGVCGLMVLLLLVVGEAVSAGADATADDLVFSGSGWGDGVGLSQYGARSMADGGASSTEILEHYFPEAELRHIDSLLSGSFILTDPTPMWVGLLQNQADVSFRLLTGSAELCFDISDQCVAEPLLDETWTFGSDDSGFCSFSRLTESGVWFDVAAPAACSGSVRLQEAGTTISLPIKGRVYRGGTLRFRTNPDSGRLHLSLEIGIDDYVAGVQELPDSWPRAALQAQAIASRSLAVRRILEHGPADGLDEHRRTLCVCHVRDDDPIQVFGGHTAEAEHPFWSGMVGGTSGQVLAWNNTVIEPRFTSSSGGRTESNEDAGRQALPYLVSVDDAAAHTSAAANPFTAWTASTDQRSLGGYYGFSWLNDASVVSRHESGSAATIRLSGIVAGHQAEVLTTGSSVRRVLGLFSPYFDIQVVPRFVDVGANHPFAGEILGLHDLGVTLGCRTGMFCPSDSVSRGQMAAFLVRILELTQVADGLVFTDDDDSVFENEISTLWHHGITTGCTVTTFCPERAVSRGEMASFLVRAFELPAADGDSFDDDDGSVFEADIEALKAAGVTMGCTPNSFCPDLDVTREQMAAFLIRARSAS